ncbi:hypothetical protein QQP08_002335 [Theobroma cacao]|nr:hypothetical protein QQP08_002335 [Theobroma cacao]
MVLAIVLAEMSKHEVCATYLANVWVSILLGAESSHRSMWVWCWVPISGLFLKNQKEVNCVEVIHSQGPKQVLKAEASQNYESGSGVSPVQIVDCVGHSPTRTI